MGQHFKFRNEIICAFHKVVNYYKLLDIMNALAHFSRNFSKPHPVL